MERIYLLIGLPLILLAIGLIGNITDNYLPFGIFGFFKFWLWNYVLLEWMVILTSIIANIKIKKYRQEFQDGIDDLAIPVIIPKRNKILALILIFYLIFLQCFYCIDYPPRSWFLPYFIILLIINFFIIMFFYRKIQPLTAKIGLAVWYIRFINKKMSD